MTTSESVVIHFPSPRNPLHSFIANEYPLQAAAEYRAALLAKALQTGWVGDYSGIRISAKGQRFRISDTILWTVTDAAGRRHGQAALIGAVQLL